MSQNNLPEDSLANATREEIMSALFGQMVFQLANMALMLMGKLPNPQNGETLLDLEAAKQFVDQLEMLEAKTKGNLTRDESNLLKQALTTTRMTFVQVIEAQASDDPVQPAAPAKPTGDAPPAAETQTNTDPTTPSMASEDEKKKFTKKY
jgi:hypothetical protein